MKAEVARVEIIEDKNGIPLVHVNGEPLPEQTEISYHASVDASSTCHVGMLMQRGATVRIPALVVVYVTPTEDNGEIVVEQIEGEQGQTIIRWAPRER